MLLRCTRDSESTVAVVLVLVSTRAMITVSALRVHYRIGFAGNIGRETSLSSNLSDDEGVKSAAPDRILLIWR